MANTSGLSIVPFQGAGSINRRKNTTTSAIDNVNVLSKNIDFSFCNYTNTEDIKNEVPRASPRKSKLPDMENKKASTKSVRLNNNKLCDVSCIKDTLEAHTVNPLEVEWIDLSFNELTNIDPVIMDFERLQILYFHGNKISDLTQIEKLRNLRHLRKLTLHGNTIENQKMYKQYVLSTLPQLHCLDFSLITNADRITAATWNKIQNKGPKKQKPKDDED
ncbi:leucine-rich repeat-containing protein 51-like isoform X1 [Mizuhopecten yessoensis]|uniref:Leucine-rich repeat-containing protein 51 n=1 Tax=Mizuhopecten yessoensis TaxID=6573 RepID=A0A210QBC2_MIZYE|nr:leucine-rich repeat-containing protein 51-like isoform X1 [Mizuhopecten yessoensis]OWF46023.1 Leucine-rich repeat-containing protein 51 [Mizuhopecten yessoensis]